MGSLFWADFVNRVLAQLTNYESKANQYKELWHSQIEQNRHLRTTIFEAINDEDARENLTACDSCKDVIIFDVDVHIMCDCGAHFCGNDEECDTLTCTRCDDIMCIVCSTYCEECEKTSCKTCVPEDQDILHEESDGTYIQYCGETCKGINLTKRRKINTD